MPRDLYRSSCSTLSSQVRRLRKELRLQPTICVAPDARCAMFTTNDLNIPPSNG